METLRGCSVKSRAKALSQIPQLKTRCVLAFSSVTSCYQLSCRNVSVLCLTLFFFSKSSQNHENGYADNDGTITQAPRLPDILLPSDPVFHPSANGRNGWTSGGVYEIRQEVRTHGVALQSTVSNRTESNLPASLFSWVEAHLVRFTRRRTSLLPRITMTKRATNSSRNGSTLLSRRRDRTRWI